MKQFAIPLLAVPIGLFAVFACSPDGPSGTQHIEEHHEESHAGEVTLSAAELEEFGVQVSVAGPGVIATTVELPGEIRPNEDLVAHIVPRFPGIVKSVRRAIGDRVSQGDVLAVIESSESLSTYSVRSLLEGLVIARHVSIGESVTTERELFVVADLSDVWVDFHAFQKHLPLLALGQRIHISAGHGLPEAEAQVSYISPVVDEATRTATVRVVVDNADGKWRPGLFVTGRVETASDEVPVAVPTTALQTIGEVPVVFVRHEDRFRPRPVRLGRAGPHYVEITAGLEAGERFVAAGGFTLKAELQRGELGEGHGH
ncbi:MAG: efflux RND transporter periplasmic adaptor subunit [Deltaproteobacteria bacterium]|nr:efflux RND transporter periplasmic adaptor subunit [Deltaproteobacteria bacterium]MBW2362859.1 efflux RND transporter periplasmic adaptor subunit [Deltaproteobacteria bacterium]